MARYTKGARHANTHPRQGIWMNREMVPGMMQQVEDGEHHARHQPLVGVVPEEAPPPQLRGQHQGWDDQQDKVTEGRQQPGLAGGAVGISFHVPSSPSYGSSMVTRLDCTPKRMASE